MRPFLLIFMLLPFTILSQGNTTAEKKPLSHIFKRARAPIPYFLFLFDYNEYDKGSSNEIYSIEFLDNELANLFEESDLGKAFFISETEERYFKYEPIDPQSAFPLSGFSVQEMMLNVAESEARLVNLDEAMEYLSKLSINRIDRSGFATEEEFLDAVKLNCDNLADCTFQVLSERRRELMSSGLRWFDIKRIQEQMILTKLSKET